MKDKSAKIFLHRQLKGSYVFLFWAIVFMAIGSFFSFLGPRIIGITVDSIIGDAPFDLPNFLQQYIIDNDLKTYLINNLYIIVVFFVIVTAINAICEFARLNLTKHLSENLSFNMRQAVFERLQNAPFAYHKNVQTGDIIQRCSSDIETVRMFVLEATDIVRIIFRLLMAYWFMISISSALALVSFITVPLVMAFSIVFYSLIQKKFLIADEAEGQLQSKVQENLSAPRVVRAFGKQKFERDNFDEKNVEYSNLWIKVGDLLAWFWSIGDFLTIAQVVTVLVASIMFAASGAVSTGDIISFMLYNGMLAWPIRSLGRIIGNMSKATVALERVNELYTVDSEDFDSGESFEIKGDIVFDKVCFDFDGQEVFKDLSFTINKGQTVALLGAAGSGKSTILALIARFYTPTKGRITIDSKDINDINISSLRKQIGIVMQEPFLFSRTIAENIAISDKIPDMQKVIRASDIACVHSSIEGFEKKYDTLVGEKGVTLSGGQKQRVAIARTLYTGAKVLCFDDSLSAVDAITDSNIRQKLKFHTENITTFIISQRVNTLMQSDKILVLDEGKIVEEGTHSQLVELNGIYQGIVKIQQEVIEQTKQERGS